MNTTKRSCGVPHWQQNGHAEDGRHQLGPAGTQPPATAYNFLTPDVLTALRNNAALRSTVPYTLRPCSSDSAYLGPHSLPSSSDLPDGQDFRTDPRPGGYSHFAAHSPGSQAFPLEDGHPSVQEDGFSDTDYQGSDRRQSKKTEMNRKAQQRYRYAFLNLQSFKSVLHFRSWGTA